MCRTGWNFDSIREQVASAGDRPSAQRERGRLQIGQDVQVLQHEQPVGETLFDQAHHREPSPRPGGHRQPQDARQRRQRHPTGDGRRRRYEMLRRINRYHQFTQKNLILIPFSLKKT